jgi:hypothetical protein
MNELHDIDICDNYNIDSMQDTRGNLDNTTIAKFVWCAI